MSDEKKPLWVYVSEHWDDPNLHIVRDLRTSQQVAGLTAEKVLEIYGIDIRKGDKIPSKPR